MTGLQSVTAVTIAGAFVVGMTLVLLGSIRPLLAKRLALGETRIDWLLAALNLALIPMMLLGGMFLDQFGVRIVFIVGSLLTTAAVFTLAQGETPSRVLGAVLAAGAGSACLSVSSTVLMSDAFFPGEEAASQNLGNVFFALGALLTPAIVDRLIPRLGPRRALSLLAVVGLLPALLAALTGRGVFPPREPHDDLALVFAQPALWLTALVFFLYAPVEESVGLWASRYLNALGFNERRALWLLAGFWLAFLAGRLLAALLLARGLLRPIAEPWFIALLGLAAGICLGNLAGSRARGSAAVGLLLLGAFLGPIFPTLVGILFEHFTQARGTAYGAMFGVGAVGQLFVPPVLGIYARRTTVQRAMHVPMVLSLLVALAALVLALYPFLR
jgi:fucose permease